MPTKPALRITDESLPVPDGLAAVDGFEATLDTRGERSLVTRSLGWAGRFLYEVDLDTGKPRVLAKLDAGASARWVDDEHVMVSHAKSTWVGRRGPEGLRPVAGIEGLGGPITSLGRHMFAIDSFAGWQLLAFRDGMLRPTKGTIKPPADAAKVDRELIVHAGRVFAATRSGTHALELEGWDLADEFDSAAAWRAALAKLVEESSVPTTASTTGVGTVQSDRSRWRFETDSVSVEVAGAWYRFSLPEPLAGKHYAELPALEQSFLVDRLVRGAVESERERAWLVTGGCKLIRTNLTTGESEVVSNLPGYSANGTRGVFLLDPLEDGRVVVVGASELFIVDPSSDADPSVHHVGNNRPDTWGCASTCQVSGDLLALVSNRASKTKQGVPSCLLELVQVLRDPRPGPRQWLSWELPMYAPTLEFDGSTLEVRDDRHCIALELGAALEWYREQWSTGRDVPALPPG